MITNKEFWGKISEERKQEILALQKRIRTKRFHPEEKRVWKELKTQIKAQGLEATIGAFSLLKEPNPDDFGQRAWGKYGTTWVEHINWPRYREAKKTWQIATEIITEKIQNLTPAQLQKEKGNNVSAFVAERFNHNLEWPQEQIMILGNNFAKNIAREARSEAIAQLIENGPESLQKTWQETWIAANIYRANTKERKTAILQLGEINPELLSNLSKRILVDSLLFIDTPTIAYQVLKTWPEIYRKEFPGCIEAHILSNKEYCRELLCKGDLSPFSREIQEEITEVAYGRKIWKKRTLLGNVERFGDQSKAFQGYNFVRTAGASVYERGKIIAFQDLERHEEYMSKGFTKFPEPRRQDFLEYLVQHHAPDHLLWIATKQEDEDTYSEIQTRVQQRWNTKEV